jgi:type IV secretory system conjugative DNA transfer VirD4/TraG family protein
MLNLKRIFKTYEETGSLNAMVNLFGFIGPQVFLTKSGDAGIVLELEGVDYECLDTSAIDAFTKRLESALRLFDENYRVYQLLFKRNRQAIPHTFCGKPVVDTAIRNRVAYFAAKSDNLFSLSIYFVVLCPAISARHSLASSLFDFRKNPRGSIADLRAHFSSQASIRLDDVQLTRAEATLRQKVESFRTHVSDFVSVRILGKDEAFVVFKRTLNVDPLKLDSARLKHDTFLDYYLCESQLECHRSHLCVDDYFVKVLTLKEPSAHTFPLLLKGLLDVRANCHVVTEWKKEEPGKTRRTIQAKRRHFHNTRRSFFSQVNLNDAPAQDTLLDDAKESQVRELGKGIEEIELRGNYFGQFSLTVVIYDRDLAAVERAAGEVYKVFGVHDAQLYDERYNLLNSFLAAVPGNYAFNLRYLYLLNTNYADLSFLFTLDSGETRNHHLRREYLAALETNHGTPYFLNLHYRDTAHSMILGRTGSGKFFSLSRQPKCIPIVATQSISSLRSSLPGESWRTLLQTFRTKIFLTLADDFSARTASELCGREDRLKVSYNLSESGHDARISLLTGNALSHRANITASKSYNTQKDYRFDMKVFTELRNAQSVVIAYDGLNPIPPCYCYLKPYYNDPNKSYFQQLEEGVL